jgi:Flp pilus assembly pilin Flp
MKSEQKSERHVSLPNKDRRTWVRRKFAILRGDIRGLAGIEFGLICGFLALAVLNVTDVSVFLYTKLQVNEATQMGAQAAWATCDLNHVPVTTKCPAMAAAVAAAIQTTSLKDSVKLVTGYPSDGYYCPGSSGALQYVSDYSSPPNNCSAAGNPGIVPGEYIMVRTTRRYSPIFTGISVAAILPSNITSSAWVRVH